MSAWLEAYRQVASGQLPISVIKTSEISEMGDYGDNGDFDARPLRPLNAATASSPTFAAISHRTLHQPAGDCLAIERARSIGWRVQERPGGLLIDTRGQPSDPDLMDRLVAAMLAADQVPGDAERWPVEVLADPGEVVVWAELGAIEGEFGQ